MGDFRLTMIRSVLREPFVCKTTMFSGSAKWLPCVSRPMLRKAAILTADRHSENGFPYGRSLLDNEVISPLGFNAFQWENCFRWTKFSLNSDFRGTNYHRGVGQHCTTLLHPHYQNMIAAAYTVCNFLFERA